MTSSYCLSPLLRLNKAHWYIICIERRRRRVTVWLYDFGEKWLSHDNYTFIHFVLAYVWKWHDLFVCSICCIEENEPIRENLLLYYLLLKRNNCAVKTIYIVFINVGEITMSCSPFIIICPVSLDAYLVDKILLRINFQRFLSVG